jgi:hypothetical protein
MCSGEPSVVISTNHSSKDEKATGVNATSGQITFPPKRTGKKCRGVKSRIGTDEFTLGIATFFRDEPTSQFDAGGRQVDPDGPAARQLGGSDAHAAVAAPNVQQNVAVV